MPPPHPRLLLVLVPLALLLLALLLPRPADAALRDRWRWPVHGRVVGVFHYAPRHAFAAAQRRGIDIAAAPGAAVRAACRGRVTFAGPVPGGSGLGVTVRCGALAATHLGLGRLAVRRGARVAAGARLGVVGPAGRLRLGARRRSTRLGYVDPLGLLAADPPPPVGHGPAPGPLGRGPRVAPPARLRPVVRSVPRVLAPRPRPAATAAARPAPTVPAGAWAGVTLLAAGVPLGGVVRRGRRRRRAARELATAAPGS